MSFTALFGDRSRKASGWFDQAESTDSSAKPEKVREIDGCCPHCQQPIADQTHLPAMLSGGFRLLLAALEIIAGGLLRLIRFGLGLVLCLAGQLGSACRSIGLHIVHPADRRMLRRLLLQRNP